ncbi:MAG: type II toxin-antitoxin system prevent-host-death family antitoxin [Mycobacterium sp.]
MRELRQNASRYLEEVAAGESIEITDRGQPVARRVPITGDPWQDLINAGEVVKAARRVASTTSNLDRGRGQLKSQLCSRPCRMRGRWHGGRSAWCGSLVGLVGPVRGSLLPPRGRYLAHRQRTCSHPKRPKRS